MRGHVRCRCCGKKQGANHRRDHNVWTYVVDVGVGDEGKRKQKWVGGFASRRDAQAALNEALGRLQSRTYVAPTRQTVREYLADWLPGVRSTVRPSTWRSYRMNVEKHVIPYLGPIALSNLRAVHINRLYADLLESGRKDGKGLSPRSVEYVHAILRRALKDAVREGLIVQNPAELARKPKASRPEQKTWNAEQLGAFLRHAEGTRFFPAYLLAGTKGLRRGEIVGLRWREDVDLEVGRVKIQQTVISIDYQVEFSEPKTPRSRRSVSLDPLTLTALKAHRARQLEERLVAGASWVGTGLVFTREDGTVVHPQALSDAFERAVRACKLPPIRFHDLRHTFATVSLQAGVPLWAVSDILGHGSVAVTDQFYRHAIPSMLDDAAKAVSALLERNSKP